MLAYEYAGEDVSAEASGAAREFMFAGGGVTNRLAGTEADMAAVRALSAPTPPAVMLSVPVSSCVSRTSPPEATLSPVSAMLVAPTPTVRLVSVPDCTTATSSAGAAMLPPLRIVPEPVAPAVIVVEAGCRLSQYGTSDAVKSTVNDSL